MQLGVLVHDPRHHLRIGARVGSGDVASGPENAGDLVDERPGDQLQLILVEIPGRTVDSSLGAAERDVEERRLPRHQCRQRANLVEVHPLVVADAALERPARPVVLHPITREHVDPGVAEPDRDLHLDLPVSGPYHGAHVLGDPEAIGRDIEVVGDGVEARRFRGSGVRSAVGNPRRLVRMRKTANRGMRCLRGARYHDRNR